MRAFCCADGSGAVISKHGFGDEYRVQHFWETEVRHAVNEGFDDFFARKADVSRGVDMDAQLVLAAALRGECGQCDQFALAQVKCRTVVDIAEGEADDLLAEVRGDIGEGGHHRFALCAVDGIQCGEAALLQFRV